MGVLVSDGEIQDHGSVATVTGIDEETGDTIVFAGDWRPMAGLAELIAEQGEVLCEVEDWQVLRRIPAGASL